MAIVNSREQANALKVIVALSPVDSVVRQLAMGVMAREDQRKFFTGNERADDVRTISVLGLVPRRPEVSPLPPPQVYKINEFLVVSGGSITKVSVRQRL